MTIPATSQIRQTDTHAITWDQRERNHRLIIEGTATNAQGERGWTEDLDVKRFLGRSKILSMKLANRRHIVSDVLTDYLKNGDRYSLTTPLGRHLLNSYFDFKTWTDALVTDLEFNPWIALIFDLYRSLREAGLLSRDCRPHKEGYLVYEAEAEVLRKGLLAFRDASKSKAFRRSLENDEKKARKNYASACSLILHRFQQYSRLLILRVDLYYKRDGDDSILAKEATCAFEQFVLDLRLGRLIDNVGWMLRRECGCCRGLHYHLLVLMDGHKYRDAYAHTMQLGEAWISSKYAGREGGGTYYNCYVKRHEYAYNGLGLVDLEDREKLEGVRRAVDYVAKADFELKVGGEYKRNFRRSVIKPIGTKLGAPRRSGRSIKTAEEILLGSGCKS